MDTNPMLTGAARRARSTFWQFPLLLAIGGSLVVACSSSDKGGNGLEPGVAAAIDILTQPPVGATNRAAIGGSVVVQVVDINGDPVDTAGISITAALQGGGALSGTTVVATDVSGQATFSSLTITGHVGDRQLEFTSGALVGITSGDITLTAGTAARLLPNSNQNQTSLKGQPVATRPAVKVTDLDSNAVAGVAVTFAITVGNGSATGLTQNSATDGLAIVGSWTLDTAAGTNTMTASAAGLTGSPLTFNATGAAVVSNFTIDLRFLGSGTANQQAAFTAAKARWEQVITGDLPNIPITLQNDTQCSGGTPLSVAGTVDDVVIFADLVPIDGVGNILGAAGPCYIRSQAQNALTIVGYMKFDTADLANLEAGGDLADVALHEMGHVLGYGTLWDQPPHGLTNTLTGGNPFYLGSNANAAYLTEGGAGSVSPAACGAAVPRSAVPLQATGGAGTALSHWEECVFQSEVMTGYISGNARPLSLTSIQSLADLGYTVNAGAADVFSLGTQPTVRAGAEKRIDLRNDILRSPMVQVDSQGRVLRIIRRQ
ncbi:MAG: hypothetical protein IPJ95_01455 [Gemmatimonadetes bacterium]|nr:hypothetical protein [Gemmatimonadota bacterium]